MTAQELVKQAYEKLAQRSGFETRENQVQLSLLLTDLIEQKQSGLFEAPTGLGKSLAALIPAIANAIAEDKTTVIATYTNVLADQYWQKDLPLALSLFSQHVQTAYLVGRQRYVCLIGLDEHMGREGEDFKENASLGTESEFRRLTRLRDREINSLWSKVQVPQVCPAKACPAYDDCFYYNARKKLEKARIIITNHSVVLADALSADPENDRAGILGKFDFLILDEAHDFLSAAVNSLEFEMSVPRLSRLAGISNHLENLVMPIAEAHGDQLEWRSKGEHVRNEIAATQKELTALSANFSQGGILAINPPEIDDHPAVQKSNAKGYVEQVTRISERVRTFCEQRSTDVQLRLERYKHENLSPDTKNVIEASANYIRYIRDFAAGAHELSTPSLASVSYIGSGREDVILRRDPIDLSIPLTELVWNRVPYACISATLLIDGEFDYFERASGAKPMFREVLPSPFDFSIQSALYLPKVGMIPDPTLSKFGEAEQRYYQALANEITQIIETCQGRTLVLFHSRKEMEGVRNYVGLSDEYPILMQGRTGISTVGEQFKTNIYSSLFALRSYWTGFDAQGETCSCVVLVRIPFEVPIDPPQIARMAYLASKELDPFQNHSLPLAKILMRQGAGRLIRSENDKGVIALLDPRLKSKRYGDQILGNLPAGMRQFDDFRDAAGWIGL
ncbi:MAG TPA: ATP-dependent DNA helicase [Fimbriimonas sp.]|nr:ATP-dependent DNA helicase [Fimbriimonas sp.]